MAGSLNIKVAVRIRPQDNSTENDIIEVNEDKQQLIIKDGDKNLDFNFSQVLSSKTTQTEVYNKCVKPLISNILKVRNRVIYF